MYSFYALVLNDILPLFFQVSILSFLGAADGTLGLYASVL